MDSLNDVPMCMLIFNLCWVFPLESSLSSRKNLAYIWSPYRFLLEELFIFMFPPWGLAEYCLIFQNQILTGYGWLMNIILWFASSYDICQTHQWFVHIWRIVVDFIWSGFYKLNLYMVICRKIIELHVLKSGSIDHFDKV